MDRTVTQTVQSAGHRQGLQLSAKAPAVFLTRQSMLVMSGFLLRQKGNVRKWKIRGLLEDVFPCFGNVFLNNDIFHPAGFPPRSLKVYFSCVNNPWQNLPVGSLSSWLSHHPAMQVTEQGKWLMALKKTQFIELDIGKEPKWVMVPFTLPEAAPHLADSSQRRWSHVCKKLAREGSFATIINAIPIYTYIPKSTARALHNGTPKDKLKSRSVLTQEPDL